MNHLVLQRMGVGAARGFGYSTATNEERDRNARGIAADPATTTTWPALDAAAAALGDYYASNTPSCSSNSTVQAFQNQYNAYIVAAGGTGKVRTDGLYDQATEQALTASLDTSTTGKYAQGSASPNLPTVPAAPTCSSLATSLASMEGALGGGTTGMLVLGGLAALTVGGITYAVLHYSKKASRSRK